MAKNGGLVLLLLAGLVLGAGGMALVSGLFKKNGNGQEWYEYSPTPPSLYTLPDFDFTQTYKSLDKLEQQLSDFGSILSGETSKPSRSNGSRGLTTSYTNGVLVSKVQYPLHEGFAEAISGLRESQAGLLESQEQLEQGVKSAKTKIRRSRTQIQSNLRNRDILEAKIKRQAGTISRMVA